MTTAPKMTFQQFMREKVGDDTSLLTHKQYKALAAEYEAKTGQRAW